MLTVAQLLRLTDAELLQSIGIAFAWQLHYQHEMTQVVPELHGDLFAQLQAARSQVERDLTQFLAEAAKRHAPRVIALAQGIDA